MATIKAIEARSVHQIQSGQVIVDLNSVIKELVENSLDAGATSIEIRFRNNGLDLIEVQDNGSGISPENYDNVALKHYTSKLSSYDDLLSLQTFGFRGEALSSLCALSDFRITTAQADQAPRATRLEFEQSGKLKKTQVVAGQKGTTASVEGLFKKLPVRRRELEKNIKREYGKVLNLLHAYACISTGVRFSVKNTQAKRNAVVFTTNGNQTTKENIANVYGAKTLLVLIALDLELEVEPSGAASRKVSENTNKIQVRGHVSRPVFGEGRQTPDRQMFFVNSRPCALPQIAKAFNEVYKSFNVAQSPFVFADFHMDTSAYDVNVSPDKRTILLHDAGQLIESLKETLQRLFESADQTVPQSQVVGKLPVARQRSLPELSRATNGEGSESDGEESEREQSQPNAQDRMKSILGDIKARDTGQEESPKRARTGQSPPASSPAPTPRVSVRGTQNAAEGAPSDDELFVSQDSTAPKDTQSNIEVPNTQPSTQSTQQEELTQEDVEMPNAVQTAFDRMRPRRVPAELATITIGNRTVTSMVGSGVPRKRNTSDSTSRPARKRRIHTPSRPSIFGHMQDFAAPGTQVGPTSGDDQDEEIEDIDDQGGEEDIEGEERAEEEDESEAVDEELEEDDVEEELEDVNSYNPSDGEASQAGGEGQPEQARPPDDDIDDRQKKKHEDAEVQRLIQEAEKATEKATQANSLSRANKLNKGVNHRDSTVHLETTVNGSLPKIQSQANYLRHNLNSNIPCSQDSTEDPNLLQSQVAAEERLSLTVTKDDFARMRILGQFNLGFILASRSTASASISTSNSNSKDELFIIDQHASDEKINFERLQSSTVVQNQRLVRPKRLDLTAVDEEVVIENMAILEKNGFVIDVDDSGDEPIGKRCSLLSLPLSKEVVFDTRDLEELIALLSESSTSTNTKTNLDIPRPSKVRKMFAMRACRSSIMIGKTLTSRQMERVVRDMGSIDKPWNCPHGRPTMRHLFSLERWEGWDEYDGLGNDDEEMDTRFSLDVWKGYVQDMAEEN
ncbi:ATP-binding mismatch repair protein PMS1 [Aspergillus undulatus]|uniref:ATP-binding mismatch repair protein PMS1 n=1 Tax=Aspergillus undulatus TaxID=1810928 RepID=UPI003CCC9826